MSSDSLPRERRRAYVRRPMVLPVRVAFLRAGHQDDAALRRLGAMFALAVDVSEGGMQLVLSGAAAKTFLSEREVVGSAHLAFVHPELKRLGDRVARVVWSRAAEERDDCVLGIKFDRQLEARALAAIMAHGRVAPPPPTAPPWWWAAGPAVLAVALGVGWASSCNRTREHERARETGTTARDSEREDLVACQRALAKTTKDLTLLEADRAHLVEQVEAALHERAVDAGVADEARRSDAGDHAGPPVAARTPAPGHDGKSPSGSNWSE